MGYPHRLLTDQENPIIAKDFSAREKAQLSTVKLISNMNKVTGMISPILLVKQMKQRRLKSGFILKVTHPE